MTSDAPRDPASSPAGAAPQPTIADVGTPHGSPLGAPSGMPSRSSLSPSSGYPSGSPADPGATISDVGQALPAAGARYEICCLIGSGGMGQVFLARDHNLHGRWVALKRLSRELLLDSRARERFNAEAEAIARLSDHHIVRIFERGEDALGPYIAMEYIPGPPPASPPPPHDEWPADLPNRPLSLHEYVTTRNPLPLPDVLALGIKLAGALRKSHNHDIIHRDVKPANVLLDEELEPKLVDFGLARATDPQSKQLTLPGSQMRTFGFGAPEQERDAATVDHRADIYGLAATLWFALSGKSAEYFRESEVPTGLRPVLVKALKTNPDDRYCNVNEFRVALEILRARAPETITVPSQDLPPGYWACARCNRANREDQRHCQACGESGVQDCPHCRRETRRGATHCGQCGINIEHFLRASDLLERARVAQSALRFSAARECANEVLSDDLAHNEQHAQASKLSETLKQSISDRHDDLTQLEQQLRAEQWDAALQLVVRVRRCVPPTLPAEYGQLNPDDLLARNHLTDLETEFRRLLRARLATVQRERDLAVWAQCSTTARAAFADEPWTRGDVCEGLERRQAFHATVNGIARSQRERLFRSVADYEQARQQLDEILAWHNHEDPAALRDVKEKIDNALKELPSLAKLWEERRYSPAQLVRLAELLPANEEILCTAHETGERERSLAEQAEHAGDSIGASQHWQTAAVFSPALHDAAEAFRQRSEAQRRGLVIKSRKTWPNRGYWAGFWFALLFFTAAVMPGLGVPGIWLTPVWAFTGVCLGILHAAISRAVLHRRAGWLPVTHGVAFATAGYLVFRDWNAVTDFDWRSLWQALLLAGLFTALGTLLVHLARWRELLRIAPVLVAWVFILPLSGYAMKLATVGFVSAATTSTVDSQLRRYIGDSYLVSGGHRSLVPTELGDALPKQRDREIAAGVLVGAVALGALVAGMLAGIVFMYPVHGQLGLAAGVDSAYRRLLSQGITIFACWVFFVVPSLRQELWIPAALVLGTGVALARLILGPPQAREMTGTATPTRRWGREVGWALLTVVLFGGATAGAMYGAPALVHQLAPGRLQDYRCVLETLVVFAAVGFAGFLVGGPVNAGRLRTMLALPAGWLLLATVASGLYGTDWRAARIQDFSSDMGYMPALLAAVLTGMMIVSAKPTRRSSGSRGPVVVTLLVLGIAVFVHQAVVANS